LALLFTFLCYVTQSCRGGYYPPENTVSIEQTTLRINCRGELRSPVRIRPLILHWLIYPFCRGGCPHPPVLNMPVIFQYMRKIRANDTTGMRKRAKSKILFFAEVRPYKMNELPIA